ncbi:MAG: hypothetical protein PHN18_10615 [Sulfurospirillaceae bacterium]|nr:hypothetical protein [Sulfurospirillaceae bacterium]MDD2827407.1 hypothetical protein [Sulfurospirillaceae bacterium]
MDINQLQEILDQITFVTNEAKKETTKMRNVAKYLATQIEAMEKSKGEFTLTVKNSYDQMKKDILVFQNQINSRLAFADESHMQGLGQISDAAFETQKSIRDFGKLLKQEMSEDVIQKVIDQVNKVFQKNEKSLFELTQLSSQQINSATISIHNDMIENKKIQNTIEEVSINTLIEVDKKLKEMREEVQGVSANINLINQSTQKTLQTIELIENTKLWSGELSKWFLVSSSAFFVGVIFTAIIAIWLNPLFKAFIAALLQK